MAALPKLGFNTRAVHADPDPATGSLQPPIFQNASYQFKSAKHAADLFNLDQEGYVYSRLTNPTVAALSKRLADLEGGVGATCVASGIAANLTALFPLMNAGDDFIASDKMYGGTVNQLSVSFQHFGWQCTTVNPDHPDNFKRALTEKTKAIFVESLSNPAGVVVDMEAVAHVAHAAGIPLIVDNTVATPYLCRPIEWGADIVTHSTTKYLCGNGSTIGGAIIDSGTFRWSPEKFPHIAQAEAAYGGRNFVEAFGPMAYTIYNHAVGLRDLGASMAPLNAFLTMNGIETLGLRMERHIANAREVASFLRAHPAVAHVTYSGFESSPYFSLAKKYMPKGAGALFTFTLKGGYEACVSFVENLKIHAHVANIGDTRSLVIHPASTTHHQLTREQAASVGLDPSMIRISVGIEDSEDLTADLEQALAVRD